MDNRGHLLNSTVICDVLMWSDIYSNTTFTFSQTFQPEGVSRFSKNIVASLISLYL